MRIDPRAQALVSLLRHGLTRAIAEPLQAETLILTLVRRALGERTSRPPGSTYGRRHEYDDLSALALDLGFSTHSHFTSAFRQLYGRTPAELQRALRPS